MTTAIISDTGMVPGSILLRAKPSLPHTVCGNMQRHNIIAVPETSESCLCSKPTVLLCHCIDSNSASQNAHCASYLPCAYLSYHCKPENTCQWQCIQVQTVCTILPCRHSIKNRCWQNTTTKGNVSLLYNAYTMYNALHTTGTTIQAIEAVP